MACSNHMTDSSSQHPVYENPRPCLPPKTCIGCVVFYMNLVMLVHYNDMSKCLFRVKFVSWICAVKVKVITDNLNKLTKKPQAEESLMQRS